MEDDPRSELERTDEANRLYWHSELGVNQIAEEMGVSKGALYTLVRPLGAGMPCPRCDSELLFPNRTARDRGFLSCSQCGFEEELTELEAASSRARRQKPPAKPQGDEVALDGENGAEATGRGPLSRENTRILLGSGLIAIAAGVILTRWLRRD